MNEEHLRELDKMRVEIRVPVILYRDLWAYAILYTQNFIDRELAREYSYQIVKAAIPKVEKKYLGLPDTRDYNYRRYSRELMQETMEELNIIQSEKIL